MSAYIVERGHIWYLVEAAQRLRVFNPLIGKDASALGQMLWDENRESVAYRYREAWEPVAYDHFSGALPAVDPVQVLKSIACYVYQSCEHEGWEGSEAQRFCDALRGAAIAALPGYEQATWGAPKGDALRLPPIVNALAGALRMMLDFYAADCEADCKVAAHGPAPRARGVLARLEGE